jgi:phosphatidylglycerophosphate synthase
MVNKILNKYECPYDMLLLKFIDYHLHLYCNISPNTITTVSLIIGFLSSYNIYLKNYRIASLLFLLSYYFDCVDGKIARKYNKVTKFGDYYDHFSDITKVIVVFILLYMSNHKKFYEMIGIFVVLFIILLLHFSCQEKIYGMNESPTLHIFNKFIENDVYAKKIIKYTKYFGSGTFIIILCIEIYFWNYDTV